MSDGTQPAEFTEIVAVTLRDRVIAAFKDSFFSGLLRPGERIVERQIAQKMGIGTPAVREALIALEEQGFVKRITNTATYVTKYSTEEVEQLYNLRVEFELLALQWAKPRHTEEDLHTLDKLIDDMIDAAERKQTRLFCERDLQFHRHCWALGGNNYLKEALEKIVHPLFAFVLVANGTPVNRRFAEEHRDIVNALRNLEEPEFSRSIRRTLTHFAGHGVAIMSRQTPVEEAIQGGA